MNNTWQVTTFYSSEKCRKLLFVSEQSSKKFINHISSMLHLYASSSTARLKKKHGCILLNQKSEAKFKNLFKKILKKCSRSSIILTVADWS